MNSWSTGNDWLADILSQCSTELPQKQKPLLIYSVDEMMSKVDYIENGMNYAWQFWWIEIRKLFGVYRPNWKFFTHTDVTINRDGLQIFTYARHSWPLSREGSLACQTNCDTGHQFIMVISKDPWHTPIAERLAVGLSLPAFTT